MKINMPSKSIFNPQIITYLFLHGFARVDDAADENIMHWCRKHTLIEFNGNEILVKAVQIDMKPFCAYSIKGFPPMDIVLFAFLMHSWGIVELKEGAHVITHTHLANSITENQFN